MMTAKNRTSFALDDETIRTLHNLSVVWKVSQAEVVRRAVRIAADVERAAELQLQERLDEYRTAGYVTAETAEQYLASVAADRAGWERGGAS